MSRGYDASSEVYSLCSHPVSMTRASTTTKDSEPIATPLDEISFNRAGRANTRGGSKLAAYGDGARIRSGSPETSRYLPEERRVLALSTTPEELEPYGPYFSLPRDLTAERALESPAGAGLTRRRTAKELIGQYESMDEQSAARPPYSIRPVHRQKVRGGSTATTEKKDKSRSPIRRSIRNFMAVFKKNRAAAKEQSAEHLTIPEGDSESPTMPDDAGAPSTSQSPGGPQIRLDFGSLKEDLAICTTPMSAHPGLSGPLLYLSRSGAPDIHPVWTSTTAALHSTHILATWSTAQGNPSTRIVRFTACTDVRSLSPLDLDPYERELLPGGTELKVFELLFEGKPREKFAAVSTTERATWVSAIWDAILQAQEQRIETASMVENPDAPCREASTTTRTSSRTEESSLKPASPAPTKTSEVSSVPHLKLDIECALPDNASAPAPVTPKSLVRYSLHDPAVRSIRSPVSALSPLPVPPVSPVSSKFLVPPSPTRTQSTSIRNLDQLSVVKQRLAALERNNSTATSPTSSRPSPRLSCLSTPTTPARWRSPLLNEPWAAMRREESMESESNHEGSIIDAYGGSASPISSISAYSARLTTAPPSACVTWRTSLADDKSQSPPEHKFTLLAVPQRAPTIFSLASRYSGDDEAAEMEAEVMATPASTEIFRSASTTSRPILEEASSVVDVENKSPPQDLQESAPRAIESPPPILVAYTGGGQPETTSKAPCPALTVNASSVIQEQRRSTMRAVAEDAPIILSLVSPCWSDDDRETSAVIRDPPKARPARDEGSRTRPNSVPGGVPTIFPRATGFSGGGTTDIEPRTSPLVLHRSSLPFRPEKVSVMDPPEPRQHIERETAAEPTEKVSVMNLPEPRPHIERGTGVEPTKVLQRRRRNAHQNDLHPSDVQKAPDDPRLKEFLGVIGESVQVIATHAETSGMDIVDIRSKVYAILEAIYHQQSSPLDVGPIMEKLEEIRIGLDTRPLPSGFEKGEEQRNVGRASRENPGQLSELHAKVNSLMMLCEGMRATRAAATPNPASNDGHNPQIQEILALLQGAQTQWASQSVQQMDSVRYLNELNSWLEQFVNHGTAHIESVAAGMQQLSKDLGPLETHAEDEQPQTGLLGEIRKLLVEAKLREDNSTSLHESVHNLMAAVQDDFRRSAEAQNTLTTECVAGLIDRQRQDHEQLLRGVASELSNEIRGERLRFVEAMKEATAINVQIHVEEFKKELTREVLAMTEEVGRLQRERQSIEQQIADLFAFYAKQKNTGGGKQTRIQTRNAHTKARPTVPHLQLPTSAPLPTPMSTPMPGSMPTGAMPAPRRRPLPSPVLRPQSSYG